MSVRSCLEGQRAQRGLVSQRCYFTKANINQLTNRLLRFLRYYPADLISCG